MLRFSTHQSAHRTDVGQAICPEGILRVETLRILSRNARIRLSRRVAIAMIVTTSLIGQGFAAEPTVDQPDLQMVTRIRQEGFRNSKVMEIMSELTDRIGPRLTGSSSLKKANDWTRDEMTRWGLQNSHLEAFDFGRGWALDSVTVRMTSPDVASLYALPKAWTPATNGVIKGQVVRLKATTIEELEKEKGKYAGKIVLVGEQREVKPENEAALKRYDSEGLQKLGDFAIPPDNNRLDFGGHAFTREELIKRYQFTRALQKFLNEEKVAAAIEGSRGDGGLIFVQGTQAYRPGESDGVPQLVMAAEQFNRILRLVDRKVPVEIELDVKSHFETPDGGKAFNTIAEIQGTDKKDEIVMVGGHLDSWHAGTGATDNAAGCAVAMEAVRILQSLGVKPRRTIRIALWGGEEQGLLGSRAYAAEHFGKRDEPTPGPNDVPSYLRGESTAPLLLKPEQTKLSAYFNIDNGTGKLRGIYAQENSAVAPLFEAWGTPFRDLGFTTVSMRNTGGTDHLAFDAVGIPGFQFIQDPVEYETRTHHSNMDVYDRVQRDDMVQASVVLASFLYQAAMRDQMLPRKAFAQSMKVVYADQPTVPGAKASDKKSAEKKKSKSETKPGA